ncbi:MAG: alpha-L-fucosidase [Lentisphaerae bacterium]|nr:alpha-L-fucosidase [Lentisphaerota bacterium]
MQPNDWFAEARFGMIVHYGLYSLLARGEWALNREQIPLDDYRALAGRFTAERFDAGALCDLAVRAGMRYIVFTTMHHDGFRLYDTALSDFSTARTAARRDLTREVLEAARARGLRVALYHSLNNWMDAPDAVAALEDRDAYAAFIRNTHARVRELVTRYNPIDVLWYDGWWPFNADGWRAEEMNAMVKSIQPHILVNSRNGLPGDFATPEQHLTPPSPWRPWEGGITLNGNWGYHDGDHDWKTPAQVVDMLATVAANDGNLLLNIGPCGDGSIPEPSLKVLEAVGQWLTRNGECIHGSGRFTFNLRQRGDHRGDWSHHGPFTARGHTLYWLLRRWPGQRAVLCGLESRVRRASLLGGNHPLSFTQAGTRLLIEGLPDVPPDPICTVLKLECDREPVMYLTGGMRTPTVDHPHYDPCPSDLPHGA